MSDFQVDKNTSDLPDRDPEIEPSVVWCGVAGVAIPLVLLVALFVVRWCLQ